LRWQAGKLHPYPRLLKPLGGFAALGRARAARYTKRFAAGLEKCDVLSRKARRIGIGSIPGSRYGISPQHFATAFLWAALLRLTERRRGPISG
jgi:hypothetical protein